MAPLRLVAQRALARSAGTTTSQHVGSIRGMATEKQIMNQINSTKNINKITSSMKMVSAAKLKGDEQRLDIARPFNAWTRKLNEPPTEIEVATTTYDELPRKVLIMPFSSERGLCGGVNSYVSRAVKDCVKKLHAAGKEADIVVVGDKGRAQLVRSIPKMIARSATDIQPPGNFALASALASELVAVGAASNYDAVVMIYNFYVNAAVYKQAYKVIPPFVSESEVEESLSGYEFDGDKAESMEDLYEYLLAAQAYHCFMDAAAAEQSSRMTAMENASKNAAELIDALTLKYNRARQARITTELIEIISGAAALEDQ